MFDDDRNGYDDDDDFLGLSLFDDDDGDDDYDFHSVLCLKMIIMA